MTAFQAPYLTGTKVSPVELEARPRLRNRKDRVIVEFNPLLRNVVKWSDRP